MLTRWQHPDTWLKCVSDDIPAADLKHCSLTISLFSHVCTTLLVAQPPQLVRLLFLSSSILLIHLSCTHTPQLIPRTFSGNELSSLVELKYIQNYWDTAETTGISGLDQVDQKESRLVSPTLYTITLKLTLHIQCIQICSSLVNPTRLYYNTCCVLSYILS